jgi:tRNA pseudouridine55 synthase
MTLSRRAVHGVVLLDKPWGMTSQQAVWSVRKALRAEKAGHSGTLDPLATGLLPICLGAATKFAQTNLDADKTYQVGITLGQTRVGGDLEGEVVLERPVDVSDAQLEAAISALTGKIDQVPPMHSALKHQGKPLYVYARAGESVERAARTVFIHRLSLLKRDGPLLTLEVHCSKGTYVRTLAEDLGEALGCGAHVHALRRIASGHLRIEEAISLEQLQSMAEAERDGQVLCADTLVAHWPQVRLPEAEAARFLTGLRRRVALEDQPAVRVYGPQERAFLGCGHVTAGELIADRLLSPLEVQALVA